MVRWAGGSGRGATSNVVAIRADGTSDDPMRDYGIETRVTVDDAPAAVAKVEQVKLCSMCNRVLRLRVEDRRSGRVSVVFECPRHGALPRGWRNAFLARVRDHVVGQRRRG